MQRASIDVWREVGRHALLRDALPAIFRTIGDRLPLTFLAVEVFDVRDSAIETVAVAATDGPRPLFAGRRSVGAGRFAEMVAWARSGQVERIHPAEGKRAHALPLPPSLDEELLAGPLVFDGEALGCVLAGAAYATHFTPEHEAILGVLLEPLATALRNDVRARENSSVRSAAEADRESLLTRLGRKQLVETVVGEHGGLHHVMRRVRQVAQSDVPVLLLGETGSGKEVVARAIHQRSRRAGGAFLRVNCGAIPPELVDSELFGHEKGSFTGATEARKGWFERADGGTLLLDEIGELPLAAQVRLLRILQDGTFQRVGGQRQLSVDVRVIAATHRDVREMVRTGSFREDLWYRIGVFPITIPPLRDRPVDIPELARHFAEKACRRFGLPPLALAPQSISMLVNYPWPGNARELAAVIDRAAILGDGHFLDVADALGVGPGPTAPARVQPSDGGGELVTLDEAMRRHITAALERTEGRIEGKRGAAALLGMNPSTLRARMRVLGVERGRTKTKTARV
jgi:hydrogenase-4 transcriptional activator